MGEIDSYLSSYVSYQRSASGAPSYPLSFRPCVCPDYRVDLEGHIGYRAFCLSVHERRRSSRIVSPMASYRIRMIPPFTLPFSLGSLSAIGVLGVL